MFAILGHKVCVMQGDCGVKVEVRVLNVDVYNTAGLFLPFVLVLVFRLLLLKFDQPVFVFVTPGLGSLF